MHDVSGQAKVADLHYLALGEEDVPGREVPVHTLPKQGEEPRLASVLPSRSKPTHAGCICFVSVRFILLYKASS